MNEGLKALPLSTSSSTVDLASIILWERIHETQSNAGICRAASFALTNCFDFLGEPGFSSCATRDYKGFGFIKPIAGVVTDDGAFHDGLVLQQAVFNFGRRDKDAGNLQHVVSAAVIPIVTFRVDVKLISGRAPIARKSFF